MKEYEAKGYKCLRTAGSHGEFDVIAYKDSNPPIFIQVKAAKTEADANLLTKSWKRPMDFNNNVIQQLAVRVDGKGWLNSFS